MFVTVFKWACVLAVIVSAVMYVIGVGSEKATLKKFGAIFIIVPAMIVMGIVGIETTVNARYYSQCEQRAEIGDSFCSNCGIILNSKEKMGK